MKKVLIVFMLLCFTEIVYSQGNKLKEEFYLFDNNWNGVKKQDDAAFFGHLAQLSDTCWQWDIYYFTGPRIKRLQFKNEQQTIAHGKLLFYNSAGYFDSTGFAINNLRHGDWYYYNDTGKAVLKKEYENGKLINTTDLEKVEKLESKNDGDDETESSFPGGINKWKNYLYKNMNYPQRAMNAGMMGTVITQFKVDEKGNIEDLDIAKSLEYSIDEEATRLIRESPKWKPAIKNGQPVNSYKKQPMIFSMVVQ